MVALGIITEDPDTIFCFAISGEHMRTPKRLTTWFTHTDHNR